jgi:hypothetical protein
LPNYDKLPTPPGINTLIILSLEGAGAKFGRGGIEIGGGGKKNILWIYISGDVLDPSYSYIIYLQEIFFTPDEISREIGWNIALCPLNIIIFFIINTRMHEDARGCTKYLQRIFKNYNPIHFA